MRQVANSADNLVLLGEMMEMASGYADQVEESSVHDEPFMVCLAHDQLSYLRKRLSKLDDKLKNLNDVLGSQIRRHARSKKWGNEDRQTLDPSVGLSHVTH